MSTSINASQPQLRQTQTAPPQTWRTSSFLPSNPLINKYKQEISTKENMQNLKPASSIVTFVNGYPLRIGCVPGENLTVDSLSQDQKFVPFMPCNIPGRTGFTATCIPTNHIILFGGFDPRIEGQSQVISDVLDIDVNARTWSFLPVITEQPKHRYCHAAVFYDKSLYIFGGTNGLTMSNDLLVMNFGSKYIAFSTLTEPESNGSWPSARCGHSLTVFNDTALLFGGMEGSGSLSDELWELSFPKKNESIPVFRRIILKNSPPPRHGHIAFIRDGKYFIAGGYDKKGKQLNDIWTFNDSSWTQTAFFEIEPFIFHFNDNIFSVSNDGQVKKVVELEALKSLDEKFNLYISRIKDQEGPYALLSEKVTKLQSKYQKLRTINQYFQSANNNNGLSLASEYFNEGKVQNNQEKIKELRKQYNRLANNIIDDYIAQFLVSPDEPENLLDQFIRTVKNKLEAIKANSQKQIREAEIEYEISNKLVASIPNPQMCKDETYKLSMEYAQKIILLDKKKQQIESLKTQIRRADERATINQQKLNELLDNIEIIQSRNIHEDKKQERWQAKINKTLESIQKSQSVLKIMQNANNSQLPQQQVNEITQNINQLKNNYKEHSKLMLPDSSIRILKDLSGVIKILKTGQNLDSVKERIRGYIQILTKQQEVQQRILGQSPTQQNLQNQNIKQSDQTHGSLNQHRSSESIGPTVALSSSGAKTQALNVPPVMSSVVNLSNGPYKNRHSLANISPGAIAPLQKAGSEQSLLNLAQNVNSSSTESISQGVGQNINATIPVNSQSSLSQTMPAQAFKNEASLSQANQIPQLSSTIQQPPFSQPNQQPSLSQPNQQPPLSLSNQQLPLSQTNQQQQLSSTIQQPPLSLSNQQPPLFLSNQQPPLSQPNQQPPLSLSNQQPPLSQPNQQPQLSLSNQQPQLSLSNQQPPLSQQRQLPQFNQNPSISQPMQQPPNQIGQLSNPQLLSPQVLPEPNIKQQTTSHPNLLQFTPEPLNPNLPTSPVLRRPETVRSLGPGQLNQLNTTLLPPPPNAQTNLGMPSSALRQTGSPQLGQNLLAPPIIQPAHGAPFHQPNPAGHPNFPGPAPLLQPLQPIPNMQNTQQPGQQPLPLNPQPLQPFLQNKQ